jgi:hypothetical protein
LTSSSPMPSRWRDVARRIKTVEGRQRALSRSRKAGAVVVLILLASALAALFMSWRGQ